jgi:hypothetical protein
MLEALITNFRLCETVGKRDMSQQSLFVEQPSARYAVG